MNMQDSLPNAPLSSSPGNSITGQKTPIPYSRTRVNPLFDLTSSHSFNSSFRFQHQHQPKWTNPNLEHRDSVCPLKPFSQMIASYNISSYNSELQRILKEANKLLASQPSYPSSISLHDDYTSPFFPIYSAIQKLNLQTLSNSKVQYLSEGLSRKLDHLSQKRRIYGKKLSSFIVFETRKTHQNSSKWGVWNWGHQTKDKINYLQYCKDILDLYNSTTNNNNFSSSTKSDCYKSEEKLTLGLVRTGQVLDGQGKDMIISLCAHPFSEVTASNWWQWYTKNDFYSSSRFTADQLSDTGLFAIHIAEVTILHRVSCVGLHKMLPSPISSIWQAPYQTRRHYSVYEQNRSEWNLSVPRYELNSQKYFMSLLVSRHAIIEMAYPLVPSELYSDSDSKPSNKSHETMALSGTLGEPLLSYVHPEDTIRLVKALKIAWDEKLDVYYYYERLYNHRDTAEAIEKHVKDRKRQDIAWREDGIRVHNSVVELTVQWRMIPYEKVVDGGVNEQSWRPFDWDDPDMLEKHCRFVNIELCRWPAILTPPKPQFHHFSRFYDDPYQDTSTKLGAHNEHQQHDDNGFVLVSVKPIAERTTNDNNTLNPISTGNISHKNSISIPINETPSPSYSDCLDGSSFANSLSRLERSLSSLSLANNRSVLNNSFESLRVVSDELIEEEYTSDGSAAYANTFSPGSPALSTSASTSKRASGYFPIDFLCEDSNFWKLPQRKQQHNAKNGEESNSKSNSNQLSTSSNPVVLVNSPELSNIEFNNITTTNGNAPDLLEFSNLSNSSVAVNGTINVLQSGNNNIGSRNLPIPIQNQNQNQNFAGFINNLNHYGSSTSNSLNSNLHLDSNSNSNTIKPSTAESELSVNSASTINSNSSSINGPSSSSNNTTTATAPRSPSTPQSDSSMHTFNKSVYSRPPRGFFPRQKRIGPVRSAILVQAQLGAMKNQINSKN